MFDTLPKDIRDFMSWNWTQIQPYADDLLARPLSAESINKWLSDWATLASLIGETSTRLEIRTTTHTDDEAGQQRFSNYAEHLLPKAREFEQRMKEKLLASGLEPEGFAVPLRRMRADAAIFRSENLPIHAELQKLGIERNKLSGAWSIEWEGEELTFSKAVAKLEDPDRNTREQIWRRLISRVQQDRAKLDDLWVKAFDLRLQMAHNAGFDNFREYRWRELGRFDYTPEDCKAFHRAIEAVVVPAASRLNDQRKAWMGLDTLRVWDNFWFADPDPKGRQPLVPYTSLDKLHDTIESIFRRVDPQLGAYYRIMRDEDLLDLESRKHKSGGGYMAELLFSRRPFIFGHAVGTHDSVLMLLHESGHSFHCFEVNGLPYFQQRQIEQMPMEFAEVASMAMELLASPYLAADEGGFYSPADAARARARQLENIIKLWPYMSAVDSFQHWIYENPEQGRDPQRCSAAWSAAHRRFMPDFDWAGIEDGLEIYWHIQSHIAEAPFYYIEYGLALLGAVQIWARARQNQAQAVADYRRALSAGNTLTLPALYERAGAKLAFDAEPLQRAVELAEQTIAELDPA